MAHVPLTPRRFFTFRVLVAFCFFALSCITGFMTGFGPELVLGPPRPDTVHSLREAIDVQAGRAAPFALAPASLGPGIPFRVAITIPGGMEGYMRLDEIQLDTDNSYWPGVTIPRYNKKTWDAELPKQAPTQPVQFQLGGLVVPLRRQLAYADVRLTFTMTGLRPEATGDYYREVAFKETVEVWLKLGRGRIAPTGWAEFDPYNPWTTGEVSLLALGMVVYILRRDRPDTKTLPKLAKVRRPQK